MLEIGCGPGTATIEFAKLLLDNDNDIQIVCVEPNPAFCEIARRNLAAYSNAVTIHTAALEEWEPNDDDDTCFRRSRDLTRFGLRHCLATR